MGYIPRIVSFELAQRRIPSPQRVFPREVFPLVAVAEIASQTLSRAPIHPGLVAARVTVPGTLGSLHCQVFIVGLQQIQLFLLNVDSLKIITPQLTPEAECCCSLST